MIILVMFHPIRFRDFKTFYGFVSRYWQQAFPGLSGYTQFISLLGQAMVTLNVVYAMTQWKTHGDLLYRLQLLISLSFEMS